MESLTRIVAGLPDFYYCLSAYDEGRENRQKTVVREEFSDITAYGTYTEARSIREIMCGEADTDIFNRTLWSADLNKCAGSK